MLKNLWYLILGFTCAQSLCACQGQPSPTSQLFIDQGTELEIDQGAGREAEPEVSQDQNVDLEADVIIQPNEYSLIDLEADPLSKGPAHVGYMSEDIAYRTAFDDQERNVRLVFWYPGQANTGEGDASYPLFSPDQAEANARPKIDHTAPLLVYSHGAKVWPEMGAFMAEYFASHGWVVLAVAHTGDSLDNVAGERPDQIYAWRPLDLSAALDHLEDLSSDHPLKGLVNTQKVLVSGHSFGGYTTLVSAGAQFDLDYLQNTHCHARGGRLCESLMGPLGTRLANGFFDTRFSAAIPQSAGNYNFLRSGTSAIQIPVLMITATRDQSCTEEGSNQPFWDALSHEDSVLRQQHKRLSFLEAGHATFTTACQHLPYLEQDDGCGPDFTPYHEAQQLMLAYSLIFARAHILGDSKALEAISLDEGLPNRESWVEWLSVQ